MICKHRVLKEESDSLSMPLVIVVSRETASMPGSADPTNSGVPAVRFPAIPGPGTWHMPVVCTSVFPEVSVTA